MTISHPFTFFLSVFHNTQNKNTQALSSKQYFIIVGLTPWSYLVARNKIQQVFLAAMKQSMLKKLQPTLQSVVKKKKK